MLLAVLAGPTNIGLTLKKALLSTKTMVGETFSKICHCSDPNMSIHEVVIDKLPLKKTKQKNSTKIY